MVKKVDTLPVGHVVSKEKEVRRAIVAGIGRFRYLYLGCFVKDGASKLQIYLGS